MPAMQDGGGGGEPARKRELHCGDRKYRPSRPVSLALPQIRPSAPSCAIAVLCHVCVHALSGWSSHPTANPLPIPSFLKSRAVKLASSCVPFPLPSPPPPPLFYPLPMPSLAGPSVSRRRPRLKRDHHRIAASASPAPPLQTQSPPFGSPSRCCSLLAPSTSRGLCSQGSAVLPS